MIASATLAAAQTYSVLYSFAGGTDGANPWSLTRDATTGNLYGVTEGGGSGGKTCYGGGCGTVFELTSTGIESVLHIFTGPDGARPLDVFRDVSGNLFGPTVLGGAGNGVVFEIDSEGAEKVLQLLPGFPQSGLIQDANTGDFYGVTGNGGSYGGGTLYEATAKGVITILHSFGGDGDGVGPLENLAQDAATGNLYGMFSDGGSASPCGGVFETTPGGVETVLYFFTNGAADGCQASYGGGPGDPGLIMDAQGNLFGTTSQGGIGNQGVVFELTESGVEKVLYRFKGKHKGDGALPLAGLVLDESTGNFYGTTERGGTYNWGTVFELSPPPTKHGRWRETVLYSFTGGADGGYPLAGLVRDAQTGDLYGTARDAHSYNWGVVFKLTP